MAIRDGKTGKIIADRAGAKFYINTDKAVIALLKLQVVTLKFILRNIFNQKINGK